MRVKVVHKVSLSSFSRRRKLCLGNNARVLLFILMYYDPGGGPTRFFGTFPSPRSEKHKSLPHTHAINYHQVYV
jgi:hypothetical protein